MAPAIERSPPGGPPIGIPPGGPPIGIPPGGPPDEAIPAPTAPAVSPEDSSELPSADAPDRAPGDVAGAAAGAEDVSADDAGAVDAASGVAVSVDVAAGSSSPLPHPETTTGSRTAIPIKLHFIRTKRIRRTTTHSPGKTRFRFTINWADSTEPLRIQQTLRLNSGQHGCKHSPPAEG